MDSVTFGILASALAVLLTILIFGFVKQSSSSQTPDEDTSNDNEPSPKESKPKTDARSGGETRQAKSKYKGGKIKLASDTFTHPLLVTSLKGHAGEVTSFDISSSGKYLISTATDRSLFLWTLKDLGSKGLKSVRANVEFDSAQLIKFSPDNKSFITSLENGNSVRVFKLSKGEDGSLGKVQQALDDFPKTHDAEIINIGIDSAGNYVMTADSGTKFDILSLRGEKLCSVDTGTMKNKDAAISPCGRFVAVCGFTPDVKVWAIVFDKTKQFKSAKRAFDLKGHKAGVTSIAFSADSSRIATISKDATWKLWKSDVEYDRGQDPVLLHSGEMTQKSDTGKVAISPDGRTVAIAIENDVAVYNGITQERDLEFKSIFSSEVRHLMFSVDGRHLFCCGDRQVKVFSNVTGYKSKISDLTLQLQSCNKNMERRLTDQLEQARKALATLGQ